MVNQDSNNDKLFIGDYVSFITGGIYGDLLQGHIFDYLYNEAGDIIAVIFRVFSADFQRYSDYTEPVFAANENTELIARYEDSPYLQYRASLIEELTETLAAVVA